MNSAHWQQNYRASQSSRILHVFRTRRLKPRILPLLLYLSGAKLTPNSTKRVSRGPEKPRCQASPRGLSRSPQYEISTRTLSPSTSTPHRNPKNPTAWAEKAPTLQTRGFQGSGALCTSLRRKNVEALCLGQGFKGSIFGFGVEGFGSLGLAFWPPESLSMGRVWACEGLGCCWVPELRKNPVLGISPGPCHMGSSLK